MFQTLPRLLSLWLDYGQRVLAISRDLGDNASKLKMSKFNEIHKLVKRMSTTVPAWQFATAIPQLISRICHKNSEVHELLESVIMGVLAVYPHQTVWHLMAVSKSNVAVRSDRISSIFSKIKVRVH